jgi:hypothetical protein
MLFNLDIDIEALPRIPTEALTHVIEELARARRMGHHLVVIRPETARWLVNNLDLSKRDLAMISRIGQEFPQTGALRARALIFIRIVEGTRMGLA